MATTRALRRRGLMVLGFMAFSPPRTLLEVPWRSSPCDTRSWSCTGRSPNIGRAVLGVATLPRVPHRRRVAHARALDVAPVVEHDLFLFHRSGLLAATSRQSLRSSPSGLVRYLPR